MYIYVYVYVYFHISHDICSTLYYLVFSERHIRFEERESGRERASKEPQAYKARVIYDMFAVGSNCTFPSKTLAQPEGSSGSSSSSKSNKSNNNNYDNKEANIAPLLLRLLLAVLPASGKKDPIFRYNPPPSAQK